MPEAELYRRNVTEPEWATDSMCAVRGGFPENYLSLSKVAANLDMLDPHIDGVLEALASFDSYDGNTGETSITDRLFPKKLLWFETPQPIAKACIQISREDAGGASRTIQRYLAAEKEAEDPHRGHVEVVTEWAEEMGLLSSVGQ